MADTVLAPTAPVAPTATSIAAATTTALAGGMTVQLTSAQEASTGVKDFVAALAFLDDGIKHLGEAPKDELVELAQKYL